MKTIKDVQLKTVDDYFTIDNKYWQYDKKTAQFLMALEKNCARWIFVYSIRYRDKKWESIGAGGGGGIVEKKTANWYH